LPASVLAPASNPKEKENRERKPQKGASGQALTRIAQPESFAARHFGQREQTLDMFPHLPE
jgi:hypothetical protein